MSALDRVVKAQSVRVAHRLGAEPAEVAQLVRVHLLTPRDDEAPRLLQYRGRGSLAAWVRVIATRLALNAARPQARIAPSGPEFCEPIAASTPELRALRQERQAVFVVAFRAAYRDRPEDERRVLKLYFVAKKTLAEIGAEIGVHTSTAARRVTAARTALLENFQARLEAALEGSRGDAPQLMEILRSRLALSDAALLKTEPDAQG